MSVVERTEQRIDLRCPVGPRALLGKVVASGDQPTIGSDNLLELACRDCTKVARKVRPRVAHVVHRFNVLGQLVESVAIEED